MKEPNEKEIGVVAGLISNNGSNISYEQITSFLRTLRNCIKWYHYFGFQHRFDVHEFHKAIFRIRKNGIVTLYWNRG